MILRLKRAYVDSDAGYGATARRRNLHTVPICSRLFALPPRRTSSRSITGNVREGSFYETSRPLPGWKDCTIYGDKTYACHSEDIATAETAEGRLNGVVQQVNACFGEGWWINDQVRTSLQYVVLHHPVGLATMTISTDEDRKNVHVVRLIMFLAR